MVDTVEVRFDADNDRLYTRDGEVALTWRAARFLEMLAAADGELVTRDAVQATLWPDVIVTRNSVDQLLTQTRQCLDAAGLDGGLLETVPRQGYRLKFRFMEGDPPQAQKHGRLLASGMLLAVTALASAMWLAQQAEVVNCRVATLPLELPDDNESVMHVFASEADFEAFAEEKRAVGIKVQQQGAMQLGGDERAIICIAD